MAKRQTGNPGYESFQDGDAAIAALLEGALLHEERTDRLTHGFHTYPAGLHPDAARDLMAAFPADRMLDPFCGGGTTLVEGRILGREVVGRDVSPVALRVAATRTATPGLEVISAARSRARKLTEAARHAKLDPSETIYTAVEAWYAPHALWELESLRHGISESDEAVRELLWTAFSSLLIKVSWRASDTSNQRQKHRRPPGTTAILFHKKVRELGRRLEALAEVVPEGTAAADVRFADARTLRLDSPVQLIVTSPPYPSTYDYLSLQHLRAIWLPDERPDWEIEIGPRRAWRQGSKEARKAWLSDTDAWTASCARALDPDGVLVVVIGDGLTPAGAVDTAQATESAARSAGLKLIARASVERPDHARETIRWEHAFAFRKV